MSEKERKKERKRNGILYSREHNPTIQKDNKDKSNIDQLFPVKKERESKEINESQTHVAGEFNYVT
jgi:hypothetical protein